MKIFEITKCLSCGHRSTPSADKMPDKSTVYIKYLANCPHCEGAKSSMHQMLFEANDGKPSKVDKPTHKRKRG